MTESAVSIPEALAAFGEQWQPHRLTSVNDQDVKIARIQGDSSGTPTR